MFMDNDHSSPGIQSEGHRSRSKVNVKVKVNYSSIYPDRHVDTAVATSLQRLAATSLQRLSQDDAPFA